MKFITKRLEDGTCEVSLIDEIKIAEGMAIPHLKQDLPAFTLNPADMKSIEQILDDIDSEMGTEEICDELDRWQGSSKE